MNNWVLQSIDKGKVTGLLFVDISKAFDSLNHKVLLRKLEHLGLSERSLRWFRSYLAHRQQSVLINGELSEPHTITLGVPQGSILGPLLFNVYINSLPNAVKEIRMILYADDAVLFCDASTRQEPFKLLWNVNSLKSVTGTLKQVDYKCQEDQIYAGRQ